MKNKLKSIDAKYSDLPSGEKSKAVTKDMEEWSTRRMSYKATQISDYEAGQSWNAGLFAHDREHAHDTQYYVFPIATNHEDCAQIIADSPYTIDEIPAELPLHQNCPHRYYAV